MISNDRNEGRTPPRQQLTVRNQVVPGFHTKAAIWKNNTEILLVIRLMLVLEDYLELEDNIWGHYRGFTEVFEF